MSVACVDDTSNLTGAIIKINKLALLGKRSQWCWIHTTSVLVAKSAKA